MTNKAMSLFEAAQLPQFDCANGTALCKGLLSATPKNAPPSVQKAAENLRVVGTSFQAQWADRIGGVGAAGAEAVRLDRQLDTAWKGLDMRLTAYALLPVADYPLAGRADELQRTLFPDGRAFLTLQFAQEWAHSDTLLKRIDDEGMAEEIDQVAGVEFLAAVRKAHADYGEVLGKTAPLPAETKVNLRDSLQELASAMRGYVLQVVANMDEAQPGSLEAAREALRPIEELRRALARRGSGSGSKGEQPAEEPAQVPATI